MRLSKYAYGLPGGGQLMLVQVCIWSSCWWTALTVGYQPHDVESRALVGGGVGVGVMLGQARVRQRQVAAAGPEQVGWGLGLGAPLVIRSSQGAAARLSILCLADQVSHMQPLTSAMPRQQLKHLPCDNLLALSMPPDSSSSFCRL